MLIVHNSLTFACFQILPLARIVMQSKTQACYEVALGAIRRLAPRFHPKDVHCDFERAQMNAWKSSFPRCKRRGCLFHYSKVIAALFQYMSQERRREGDAALLKLGISLTFLRIHYIDDLPKLLQLLFLWMSSKNRVWFVSNLPLLKTYRWHLAECP